MKNIRLLSLAALGLVVACGETPMEIALESQPALEAASETVTPRLYEVTIHNYTGGQPFTPPLVAIHQRDVDIFTPGRTASYGVKEIAENGNLAPLETDLRADPRVSAVIGGADGPGPVFPGGSVTFQISADAGARYVSWISMLICSNDGFAGKDGFTVPWRIGQTRSFRTIAWDAGTELNTQDFADIVPPCPVLTGVPSSDPGTGMSNPALAEGRKIHAHKGIVVFKNTAEGDLDPAIHGWSGPVAEFQITRLQ